MKHFLNKNILNLTKKLKNIPKGLVKKKEIKIKKNKFYSQ